MTPGLPGFNADSTILQPLSGAVLATIKLADIPVLGKQS
jgi:hypothetical protein